MREESFYAASHNLRLTSDPKQIEDNDHYQAIRHQINNRMGLPDWDKIKQHAEQLEREAGFNLLAAIYYATALAKTEGVKGLANGLEITLVALHQQAGGRKNAPQAAANALNWMASRVNEQIPPDQPVQADLSLLYRCERACYLLTRKIPKDVFNLQTLQHAITQQIESKLTPPDDPAPEEEEFDAEPPSPKKSSLPLGVALVSTLVVVLIGELLIWSVNPIGPDKSPTTSNSRELVRHPLDQIAPQTTQPQILNAQDVQTIRQTYQTPHLQQAKEQVIALYSEAIQRHLQAHKTGNIVQAEQLLETLNRLYPDAPQIEQQRSTLQTYLTTQREPIDTLLQRFRKFRTQAANLNQAIQKLDKKSRLNRTIRELGKALENYAISLSPLLARSLYIEDQQQQKNHPAAQRALDKLNQQINALSLYAHTLQEMLDQP